MKESDYIKAVNQPGAFQVFEVLTVDEPAAAHKGKVILTRKYRFLGRTGIDYANLAVNSEHVVQPRKWGVRRNRYFVDHTPKGKGPRQGIETVYATVFTIKGSFRTVWYKDGVEVDREVYNSFRRPSDAAAKPFPRGGYMDIVLDDITALPKGSLAREVYADVVAQAEADDHAVIAEATALAEGTEATDAATDAA